MCVCVCVDVHIWRSDLFAEVEVKGVRPKGKVGATGAGN